MTTLEVSLFFLAIVFYKLYHLFPIMYIFFVFLQLKHNIEVLVYL